MWSIDFVIYNMADLYFTISKESNFWLSGNYQIAW